MPQINTFTYNRFYRNPNILFDNQILKIWPKLKYIDPNAIYYFTLQEDYPISALQISILKLFKYSHTIINQPNNAMLGKTVRQIILIPSIYKIIPDKITHHEMIFQKRGPFARYCALFSTIPFVSANTSADINTSSIYSITFVGAHFPKPQLIDNINYAEKIINYLRIINSQFVIVAGDFNFNNYADKNTTSLNLQTAQHIDTNLRTFDKLFYNPDQKEHLKRILKNEKIKDSTDAIYYWQQNLDRNRVESYDVMDYRGGSDHNSIVSTFILDKDFLNTSSSIVTPVNIGRKYNEIIAHNKIICSLIVIIIILIIALIIFAAKYLHKQNLNIKNKK
jgi:hypothetical protein